MKHLWKLLAVSGALATGGCAERSTPVSPTAATVPTTIVVPRILESEAGRFNFDAYGIKRIITDDPVGGDDGSGPCDGCDDGSGGSSGGSTDTTGRISIAGFTEAHFDGDKLLGHGEMSYTLADHALQDLTLTTARLDGSTLGSFKFSTSKTWLAPVPYPQTMTTDGSIFAPSCDGRGFGATVHEVWAGALGRATGARETTQSQMMYQRKCTSTSGTESRQATEASSGGQLRICLREDHYSSEGQYIYTETIYCYYTAAT
jgi:hypothetical protein